MGLTTKEYGQYKGFKKESLRDNMTNLELALNALAEATITDISKEHKPKTPAEYDEVGAQGSAIVGYGKFFKNAG